MPKYFFKFILLLLILSGCEDIPRDNVLDPKNPDSYQESTILLEAFVNTANPQPYNQMALEALDSIKNNYTDRVIIAEYHRDVLSYNDPYSDINFENLYEKYVNNSSSSLKGVPDIFVNGNQGRVQGASSVSSVFKRLNPFISDLLILNSHFTLEVGEIDLNGQELDTSCKIARLGSESAENLLLKLLLVRQINSMELERVVMSVEKSAIIPTIDAGEIKTIEIDRVQFDEAPDFIIFMLTSSDELEVYQSIKANVQ